MKISLYFMALELYLVRCQRDIRERDPIRYLLGKHRAQWMFGITYLPSWELELATAELPNNTVGGELSKYCLRGL